MLDPLLRRAKDRMLAPPARAMGRLVHPNAVSLAGFAVGAGCAWTAYQHWYGAALLLWLLNRVLDGLDGSIARAAGRQSDLGAYLDILLDFAVYALIPLALALGRPTEPGQLGALGALLASFYLNAASWMFLAALQEKRALGAARRGASTGVVMPTGLIEGTETILFFSLFLLFPEAQVPLFGVMALLVALTALQRLVWATRHL